MPGILKPSIIEQNFTTETKQGEVTVNINLNIVLTVDQNGVITMTATEKKPVKEDYVIQIPDIETSDNLIEFGKEIE